MTALRHLLTSYRDAARTEREKGTYFERLAVAYLTSDPVQQQQYEAVFSYQDWAASQGWDGLDLPTCDRFKDEYRHSVCFSEAVGAV